MSDPVGAYASRISAEFMQRATEALKQGVGEGFGQSLSQAIGQRAVQPGQAGQNIGQGFGDVGTRQVPALGGVGGSSFASSLERAVNDVAAKQETSTETLGAFLRGENVELHQVMAATEEAQISLEMLIEVRNKFTEAYRSLSTMQG